MLGHTKALSQMVYLMWTYGLWPSGVQLVILGFQTFPSSPFEATMHPRMLLCSPCGKVYSFKRISRAEGSIWDRANLDQTRRLFSARSLSHCPLLSSRHCLACIPVCSNTSVWYFHWAESQAGPEDTRVYPVVDGCHSLWRSVSVIVF